MISIGKIISQAIRESKWLNLEVKRENKTTRFWAYVFAIEINSRLLKIVAYNHLMINNQVGGVIQTGIFFDNIVEAYVINHTSYDRPTDLIPFIEKNIDALSWLEYDLNDDRLINYYRKCLRYDTDPYSKVFSLIDGINDINIRDNLSQNEYSLTLEQQGQIVRNLERASKKAVSTKNETTDLAFNVLSIKTPKGLYIVAYRIVTFNPKKACLIVSDEIVFNQTFLFDQDKTSKHSLYSYFDRDCEDFIDRFESESVLVKNELMQVLRKGELLDDSPYFIDIVRKHPNWIQREFDSLADHRKTNTLSTPLQAFFGEMSHDLVVPKSPSDKLIILDYPLNPDQIRAVHNGLNYPITYVQGPPGTGKTTAIHSLLVSAFFNGRTVLVSSNNNKPINDLYLKLKYMQKDEKRDIYMPILRLGNDAAVMESLDYVKEVLVRVKDLQPIDSAIDNHMSKNKKRFKAFNEILEKYEERESIKERLDVLKRMAAEFGNELRAIAMIQAQIDVLNRRYLDLTVIDDAQVRQNTINADRSFFSWMQYASVRNFRMLFQDEFKGLFEIIHTEKSSDKLKRFNKYISDGSNLKKLLKVFPIILTTNQSAYRLGEPNSYFDLVIMDEAGQCSIGYALIPISRGERLILVGDEKQLRPVLSLSHEANRAFMKQHRIPTIYNYNLSSILLVMKEVDQFSKKILLREHYRCKRQIIDFCNKKYYGGNLIISDQSDEEAIFILDVPQDHEHRPVTKNVATLEIEKIIQYIKENNIENCGVITPFHNQAIYMKEQFEKEGLSHIPTGTVHLFQGDEKDVILFSLAITKNSSKRTYGWLKNNEELINVAMTRAKKKFILVCDLTELKSRTSEENSDVDDLVKHIESKGNAPITSSDEQLIKRTREYLTEREKELFDTLRHLFTTSDTYVVEKQVKISAILGKFNSEQLFDFGTKSVFDFVVYSKGIVDRIELVIELDGPEHEEDETVKANDALKEQICRDNHIMLIRIKNPFVRRYQYIRDELIKILTKV
jgi:very-short-patch-repair endonuclease